MSIAAKETDNEIMLRLQSTAMEQNVKITYTTKLFFIRLLAYASDHGDECPEGVTVSLSVDKLSDCLSISKRMVTLSLRVLSDCGILLRYKAYKGEGDSYKTTLKKEFYERRSEDDRHGSI